MGIQGQSSMSYHTKPAARPIRNGEQPERVQERENIAVTEKTSRALERLLEEHRILSSRGIEKSDRRLRLAEVCRMLWVVLMTLTAAVEVGFCLVVLFGLFR